MATIPPVAFSSLSMIPPPSSSSSSFVYHQDHRHSPNQTALNLDNLNLYAQQLNNSAAMCIEIGHYDRAISSLTKALQLLSKSNDTDNPEVENDNGGYLTREVCTLDACINFSQNHPGDVISNNEDPFWRPPSSSSSTNGCSGGGRYIYRRPIRVHRVGHDVLWSVTILIVTFNLAVAHHLLAITSITSVSSGRETSITRALKFYEVTLEHYNTLKNRYSDTYNNNNTITDDGASIMMQCDQEESNIQIIESIQFDMILHNNLSQVHHLIYGECQLMHRTYSQKLLSTLMVIVEPQMRNGCSYEEEDSSRIRNLYLHGFIQNTMHLILKKKQSAVAA
jgi:tetratricopeptide (TPR) repeat protein